MMQPDPVAEDLVKEAADKTKAKKSSSLPLVRFESFNEGRAM